MASSCISPAYIKSIHKYFKTIYHYASEKKYGKLVVNGSTASKMITSAAKHLNGGQKIKVYEIYESILSELYASAFNYAVMTYHNELEQYFSDENAKNTA